jgi:small subunit ribosomal protein S4
MGDIKRKPNLYSRPRKSFDAARIAEEKGIVLKYGLKNKKEIWKASAKVSNLRNRAKTLIPKSPEEKEIFFAKLNKMGFQISNIADVLALKTENWLERRLQTIVFKKVLLKHLYKQDN